MAACVEPACTLRWLQKRRMTTFRSSPIATTMRGLRVTCEVAGAALSFLQALRLLSEDRPFRDQLRACLADMPYAAFRWETPGVAESTAARAFEFVVLDDPGLARRADPAAFAEHFAQAPDATVVEFANLGRDAILVVPCPRADHAAYAHLATFVRQAPAQQQSDLWQAVGNAMLRRLGAKPVWLSTAGAGVPWLHVRLDDAPKYYRSASLWRGGDGAAGSTRP